MSKARLGFAEYRKIEDLVRQVWTPTGYRPGTSDEAIAVAAAKAINGPVVAQSVRFVRESLGLQEAPKKVVRTSRLSQEEVTRIEVALAEHPRLVLVGGKKRLTVYPLESWQNLQRSGHTRTAQNGVLQRQANAYKERYGMNLKEIAMRCGLSKSRISTRHTEGTLDAYLKARNIAVPVGG